MGFTSFFRDRSGRLRIAEVPSPPLLAWAGFGAASLMALTPKYRTLLAAFSRWSLLIWALREAWSGRSPFRRTLGAATLAYGALPHR